MKNNQMNMHRQGDVFMLDEAALGAIQKHILPDAQDMYAAAIPHGKMTAIATNVIAEGESTGHAHRLATGRILKDARGLLFLEVLKETQIVHEEHPIINLKPGYYQIARQREYSPEAIRLVVD